MDIVKLFQSLSALFLLLLAIFYFYKSKVAKEYFGAYFLPTTRVQINSIVSFLQNNRVGKVVDLGSGDGRILIKLAKSGFIADGFEINILLYYVTLIKIKLLGLVDARVYRENFWEKKLSDYNGVILFGIGFMIPEMQKKLQRELKPCSFVIAVRFKFDELTLLHSENNVHFYKI